MTSSVGCCVPPIGRSKADRWHDRASMGLMAKLPRPSRDLPKNPRRPYGISPHSRPGSTWTKAWTISRRRPWHSFRLATYERQDHDQKASVLRWLPKAHCLVAEAKVLRGRQAMTLSAKSLHRSGSISDKQMAKLQVLRGTKAQKSKMAPFMQKTKDEGHQNNKGIPAVRVNEINGPNQDKGGSFGVGGKRGPPSKGGRAGPESGVSVSEIDRSDYQTPKFPPGGNVKGSNPRTGNTKMKAKRKQPSLPMYGKFGGRPA